MTSRTYVLVHGGGHGGWCWNRLTPLLGAAGHEVYCPTLTGLGERAHLLGPDVDLDTHITDVTAVLEFEDLRDVILAGHSYGCTVITGVADRALDRIAQLVYLDGSRPQDGESLRDLAPDAMDALRRAGRTIDGVELVLFPDSSPLGSFGVTDPDALAWMHPRLTPHPWRTFVQPLRLANPGAVDAIHRTNVNCTPTLASRDELARARALDADVLFEIDTGHDLMITEPEAVAEMLLQLASR